MTDIVYAIRISNMEYSGLKIMDVKIGKSTNIENTLSQYSRGNRNIELLDMWRPNPEKNLSTTERGVHEIAENYSYDRQSEKFVFLQSGYQEFADTVNKILRNTSKQELGETDEAPTQTQKDDYTGTTPAVIKILGDTYDVNNWTEALQTAISQILQDVEDQEKITEIKGRKRDYFVDKGDESGLIAPKEIPGTDLFVETNFSANDVNRIINKALNKYGYDTSQLERYTEEEN